MTNGEKFLNEMMGLPFETRHKVLDAIKANFSKKDYEIIAQRISLEEMMTDERKYNEVRAYIMKSMMK